MHLAAAMDRELALEGGFVGNGPVVIASFNDRQIHRHEHTGFGRSIRRLWELPAPPLGRVTIAADGSAIFKLPEGMTHLPDRAFSGCSSLTSITLPSSLTSVGYAAFMDCCSLRAQLQNRAFWVGLGCWPGLGCSA